MVINSTNIKQNEQSPLILTELTKHKKNQDMWHWKCRSWIGTGTKMYVVGLNWLMEFQHPPLDKWISYGNSHKNKWIKNLHRLISTQKDPHAITKMNYKENMNSTIA